MAKVKTPSFVTEIPLKVTPAQEAVLLKRLDAARQVYNACLGEGLRRVDLMRQSKAWQAAGKLPKGNREGSAKQKALWKARQEAYQSCRKAFDLVGSYSLDTFAQQFRDSWLGEHVDTRVVKKLAQRAFTWINEYLVAARGRPHFKRFEELNSVEGITNGGSIMWRENAVVWKIGYYGKKLTLPALVDANDPVMQHGLSCRIKHVRLVRRVLNGQNRFYAQLVNEGMPLQRNELGSGPVGLDIGPSTVAIVAPESNAAQLKMFCAELKDQRKRIRVLQRKIDRQQRANNPANYQENGTFKPRGERQPWVKSKQQRHTEQQLAEVMRKQAAYRKSLHGQLINQILQMGDAVKLEKLSYKAFQKMWGKSVGVRAPGMFVARLKQKMNDAGGLFDEFSTYHTRLSQTCHGCGQVVKKELSQRWHKCECGVVAQRDLYSAFLATCVEDEEFNAIIANERWPGAGPLLEAALNDVQSGPASFGLRQQPAAKANSAGNPDRLELVS